MNEITNTHFEYSLVSDETARSLKAKKNQLDGIYFRYTSEVGQVLYEAQQELADYNNDGLFAKWVEAAGFKRQRAYEYINIYKYAVRITDNDELEIFEKQPKSIQIEMSKPSAKPEINQMVYEGEITKHKDYIEREREFNEKEEKLNQRLKQQSEIIENKNSVIAKQSEEIGKLRKQEPQVIEKEVVIEKIPDDYEFLQVNNQALETRLKESNAKLNDMAKRHKELLDQRKEVDEKSEKYDELTEAIQKAQGQLNNTQKIISDYKGVMQLLRESNDMVMKVSGLVYMDISDVVLTDNSASREFGNLLRRLTQLTNDLSKLTTKNIIEGEFTDE